MIFKYIDESMVRGYEYFFTRDVKENIWFQLELCYNCHFKSASKRDYDRLMKGKFFYILHFLNFV